MHVAIWSATVQRVARTVRMVVSDSGEHRLPKRELPMIAPKHCWRKPTEPPERRIARGPTSGKTIPIVPIAEPEAKEIM